MMTNPDNKAETAVQILLIGDNPDDARTIRDLLSKGGENRFRLVWMAKPDAGPDYRVSTDVQVIILALDPPESRSFEILARLCNQVPDLPVIILSDAEHEKSAAEALEKGAHDYLLREGLTPDSMVRAARYAIKLGKAQRSLREYENRIRAIFDRTFEFIGLMSPDGILLEANRTSLEFSGVEASEVLGKPFWQTPWWSHSAELQGRLKDAVTEAAGGRFVRFEATHKAPDGSLRYIDFSLKPIRNSQGEVILLIPEGRDITALKKVEEQLRQSKETARALLNALSDRALLLDTAGKILALNKPAAEALGCTIEECIGRNLFDLLSTETARKKASYLEQVFRSGEPLRVNEIGEGIWLETAIHPIHDSQGKVIRVAVYARDLTEEKRMEKALIQGEKLKTLGAISAEVAHEIRNPLVAIGGFARRLQKKTPDLVEAGIIFNESQRLEKILSRIGEYLKPVEMLPRKCLVNDILRESINLLSSQLNGKQIKCLLDLKPDLPGIYVDPQILKQIFINIIRNAVELTEQGGSLMINTLERGSYVYVVFKNTPSRLIKDSDLLFLPFEEGPGEIGIPLSYRLLKDMGGLLSFERQDNHIVFTLSLPKSNIGAGNGPNSDRAGADSSGMRGR